MSGGDGSEPDSSYCANIKISGRFDRAKLSR